MRQLKYTLAGIVALGSMAGTTFAQLQPTPPNTPTFAQVQDAPPTPPPIATPRPAGDVQGVIDQINGSKDSTQVIDIYSRSMDAFPNNVPLMRVYVHRLVDLDVPQFATPVAEKLIRLQPDDALAWAVVGVSEAKRGNMPDALADVCYAALRAPDDQFIETQAGQMVAWYDTATDKPAINDHLKSQLDRVRQSMANRDAYTTAYKQATDFYAKAQQANANPPVATNDTSASGQPAPVVNPQQPAPSPYGQVDPSSGYYNSPYTTSGYYAPTTAYPDYPYYGTYYDYGSPYYYGAYPYYPGIYIGGYWGGGYGWHGGYGYHGGGFHDGGGHGGGGHGGGHR